MKSTIIYDMERREHLYEKVGKRRYWSSDIYTYRIPDADHTYQAAAIRCAPDFRYSSLIYHNVQMYVCGRTSEHVILPYSAPAHHNIQNSAQRFIDETDIDYRRSRNGNCGIRQFRRRRQSYRRHNRVYTSYHRSVCSNK